MPRNMIKYEDESNILDELDETNTTLTLTDDGTTINLYYNRKWIISSKHGYAINNYICAGNKTYQDILTEVLSLYPEFSLMTLNKNKCYTIGFRHSDFHPFTEGLECENYGSRAWFIQSIDMKLFSENNMSCISYEENIGLPYQK